MENDKDDVLSLLSNKISEAKPLKENKTVTKEIFTAAGVMWALTLTGLSVGFGLLKIQGE